MNSFYEDGRLTAGDDGQHVAPQAVRLEAELLEHALAADAQRGQHRRVERAGEEEGRRGIVELVDLRAHADVLNVAHLRASDEVLRRIAGAAPNVLEHRWKVNNSEHAKCKCKCHMGSC